MKYTIKFMLLLFATSTVFFSACNKTSESETTEHLNVSFTTSEIKSLNEVESYLTAFRNPSEKGPIWNKIKAWVKSHTGSHVMDNCTGNYPCGPCAGMCIIASVNSEIVAENSQLSQDEKSDGLSIIVIEKYDDTSNTAVISFQLPDDFVKDEKLFVAEDTDLGLQVAESFKRTAFVIKKGVYPISYVFSDKGETVVDLK